MSHYRNLGGGKRDANEPQIMKRFAARGWHCEQISGNRLWDLNAYPPQCRTMGVLTYHVDVKMPDGNVTPAQVEKWTALHAKGIPVYVVRTEAEVDALVRGEMKPWEPGKKGGSVLATVNADAKKRLRVVREPGKGQKRAPRPAYEAPRSRVCGKNGCRKHRPCEVHDIAPSVLAAQEAEATFAPEPRSCRSPGCNERQSAHGYCATHAPQGMP